MKLSTNYTLGDIPANRPFKYNGADLIKNAAGAFLWMGIPCVMLADPDELTDAVRDIYTLDQTSIVASLGPVYLVKLADDEYYIEEYDETGTIHYAQYFTSAAGAGRAFTQYILAQLSELL